MASLNGRNVTDLDVTLPPAGSWEAHCRLDSGSPPAAGAATIVCGDLKLVGRILPARGGLESPAAPAVVVAGGYGWRTPLPAPGGLFKSASGVRLTTVLQALSGLVGEAYDAPAEATIDTEYGWDAGTRGRVVLADLVSRGVIPMWRAVPATGRTAFAPWPAIGAADAHGTVTHRDLVHGIRYVKVAGSVAAWQPGATVQGVTIAQTIIHEHGSEISMELWEAA